MTEEGVVAWDAETQSEIWNEKSETIFVTDSGVIFLADPLLASYFNKETRQRQDQVHSCEAFLFTQEDASDDNEAENRDYGNTRQTQCAAQEP